MYSNRNGKHQETIDEIFYKDYQLLWVNWPDWVFCQFSPNHPPTMNQGQDCNQIKKRNANSTTARGQIHQSLNKEQKVKETI